MLATIMEYLTLENMKVAGVTVGSAVLLYGLFRMTRMVFGLGRGVVSLAGRTKGAWSHLYVPGALMGAGLSVDYALANPEYFWTAIGGGISGLTMAWDGLRSRGWFGGHGVSERRLSAERRVHELKFDQQNASHQRESRERIWQDQKARLGTPDNDRFAQQYQQRPYQEDPNLKESTGGRH